jgi:hypothetical protein
MGPPRSYALRRRGEACTRSRNGIRGSGGGAGGFTAFFAALRADCRDYSASWPSRAARARRVPEAHRQDGVRRGPETYRRNGGGPSRQGRLWAVATAANSPHGLRLCGEHPAKIFGDDAGVASRHWLIFGDRLYRRPIRSEEFVPIVAVGVVEQFAQCLRRKGLRLIHTPNVLRHCRMVDGGQPPGSRGCFTPRRLPWISPLGGGATCGQRWQYIVGAVNRWFYSSALDGTTPSANSFVLSLSVA